MDNPNILSQMPENRGKPLDFGGEKSVNGDAMAEVTLITMKEAEQLLKLSSWSLYQLINQNTLPTVRIGGRRLIRLSTLLAYLKNLEDGAIRGGNYGQI